MASSTLDLPEPLTPTITLVRSWKSTWVSSKSLKLRSVRESMIMVYLNDIYLSKYVYLTAFTTYSQRMWQHAPSDTTAPSRCGCGRNRPCLSDAVTLSVMARVRRAHLLYARVTMTLSARLHIPCHAGEVAEALLVRRQAQRWVPLFDVTQHTVPRLHCHEHMEPRHILN